ncbi:MAG: hypothetical protein ACKPCG_11425 [Dolichospermum sp.]
MGLLLTVAIQSYYTRLHTRLDNRVNKTKDDRATYQSLAIAF